MDQVRRGARSKFSRCKDNVSIVPLIGCGRRRKQVVETSRGNPRPPLPVRAAQPPPKRNGDTGHGGGELGADNGLGGGQHGELGQPDEGQQGAVQEHGAEEASASASVQGSRHAAHHPVFC